MTKPLEPDEVRYLALEGGGGRGFAYLGAIDVLEKLGVMAHVDGVAGTSAGAITALMLALGMTANEIAQELATNDFTTFFDPPRDVHGRRRVPVPFEYANRVNTPCEDEVLASRRDPRAVFAFFSCMGTQPSTLARGFASYVSMLSDSGTVTRMLREILAAGVAIDLGPFAALLQGLPEYLTFFDRDMGFFSGEAARNYFDGLIHRRLEKIPVRGMPTNLSGLPFVMHKQIFGRDLLLCGANLSSGESVLFSWKHTPYFPVADAVRISMSLPVVYKPYIIEEKIPGWPPCGTYVDGGIWNNLPFREISTLSAARRTSGDIEGRQTLGLRLQIGASKNVLTGGELVARLIETGLMAGGSQVIADIEPFTLVLDTEGLDLLRFAPDEATKAKVDARSRRATYRYFGMSPPAIDLANA